MVPNSFPKKNHEQIVKSNIETMEGGFDMKF